MHGPGKHQPGLAGWSQPAKPVINPGQPPVNVVLDPQMSGLFGAILQIPQQPLAPLSDDRYYECDLLGMEVRTEEGLVVGALTDILSTTSNAIFVVRGAEGSEHLIPATKEIVRTIDVPHRMMTVRQMAGLLDEGAADAV